MKFRIDIKRFSLVVLIMLLLPVVVFAQSQNTIHILTVSTLDNGSYQGGVASLELLIQEGSGAIFIESFPLSNVDTQAVTRIATDIACSYALIDCDHYDFFYTIRTNSGYVRGPSAGGATALLALATLNHIDVSDVAMTGGISSGGLITPVGGVKEKTLAAIEENISLILVPRLAFNITDNSTNVTPLLLDDIQTIEGVVRPVYSLSEAYFLATGNPLPQKSIAEPPVYYTSKMKETSELLCQRTTELFIELEGTNITQLAHNFYNKSLEANLEGDYYSSASYCYSANLRLREQIVENLSSDLLLENYGRLSSSIIVFENQIDDYALETFSDLEAYIIVKERLFESREYIDFINQSNISTSLLSLAIERYYSAVVWSGFFGLPGEPLDIDETSLEFACIKELREVEARSNYLKISLPFIFLEDLNAQLSAAYEHYNNNNYPLCIFKASKAKATAHMFMNELQTESQLEKISKIKLQRAEELIHDQQQEGIFPILSYSYYEYSKQLQEEQPYVSLLFTEYAIAMADVGKYFPKTSFTFWRITNRSELFYLCIGIILGFVLSWFIPRKPMKKGGIRKVKKSSKKK